MPFSVITPIRPPAVLTGSFNKLLKEELGKIKSTVGEKNYNKGKFKEASDIFYTMSTSKDFEEFLTLPSYKLI